MNNETFASTQTVSQFFGTHPSIDALNLLPQFKVEYVYPPNYTALTIKCPADAVTLFRALRSKNNQAGYMGVNNIYALLMRQDRVLSFQLVDMTTKDICGLSVSKVARFAYLSDATHLILFSTHNKQEAQKIPVSVYPVANSLKENFELYDLDLVDYIRLSEDSDSSTYADGWEEFTRLPTTFEETYDLHRDYQINKTSFVK
ncbi:hypothetical protein [Larkinella sp. C7]|uniref:hypothetical protein n=1 Tax=Larkinella sp. C7 TaxID=2576607 RepID=UPI0011112A88|nr:hypothetical protein [Larkinella sp. C7]